MVKKIIGTALALSVAASCIPVINAADNQYTFGFEEGESSWFVNASNGRMTTGFDTWQKHSGARSYKFEAMTSTETESEYASIAKTFDINSSSAYKVGVWYLLGDLYTRLNGNTGGAVIAYKLLDKNGAEIPGTAYEYCVAQPDYGEDGYEAEWRGNDFYILPTKDTARGNGETDRNSDRRGDG